MTQVHDIRKMYFEEGKSMSQISRDTGRDRKTVRMYLEKDDWNKENVKTQKEAEFPKLNPFKEEIDQWLLEDKKANIVHNQIFDYLQLVNWFRDIVTE